MDLSSTSVKHKNEYYTEHIRFPKVSLVIWLIDDYTKRRPLGNVKVTINGLYLFNWGEIPGEDSNRLIEFLKRNLGIDWVQPNNITKDGTTISISDGVNSLSLELDEEIMKVTLRIKNSTVDEFAAKKENGKLKVYKERNIHPIKNLSGYYIFHYLPGGSYSVSIGSDFYLDYGMTVDTSRINNSDILLKFKQNGPPSNAISITLADVSNLIVGDFVEFRNPAGKIEQRSINGIDTDEKTISWKDKLKNDYSMEDSSIVLMKYLPVEITLKPRPSYPFPKNATLVRGYVSDEIPVENAIVKVIGEDIITATDENGEFVLYVNDITIETKITINIEKEKDISVPDRKLIVGGTLYLGRIEFP